MDELDPRVLEAWTPEPLSDGFEDRVMRAWEARSVRSPRRRRRRWAVGLALASACAAASVIWLIGPRAPLDEPNGRGLALGERVVAEPDDGTTLAAEVRGGQVVVTQGHGGANYRVDPGTAMRVETPAAVVSVHGTVFRVEVETVQNVISKRAWGISGAMLAGTVAVYVSVKDGAVDVHNEHGEVRLNAGDTALATDASAPRPVEPAATADPGTLAVASGSKRRAIDRAERAALLKRIDEALTARARATKPRELADRGEASDETEVQPEKPPTMKLDKGYIRQVIGDQLVPVAKECYDDALGRNPKLAGKLVMQFTIAGDEDVGGIVESAELGDGTDLDDPAVRECVIESLMNVAFDPPSGGGRVEVTYPMVFEPGTEQDRGQ